jgi:hypothetical protein
MSDPVGDVRVDLGFTETRWTGADYGTLRRRIHQPSPYYGGTNVVSD